MADDRGDFNIAHVAGLARLALTPDEEALFQTQLVGILAYAAEVCAVQADLLPPIAQAGIAEGATRADRVTPSLTVPDALRNAPDADAAAPLFRVPKVMG